MSDSLSQSPRATSPVSRSLLGLVLSATLGVLSAAPVVAQAAGTPQCELQRPMRFGGMNWESNLMLVEIERFIVKHGYGCDSEAKLELPPYDAAKQKCLTDPDCANPQATSFPDNPVFTAVTTKFTQQAPKLTAFLSKVKIPLTVENEAMAYMEKNQAEPKDTAMWFLKNKQDVWTQWLPADVTERVKAAL
ncbi:hypothetical protein CDEF62S_02862 [Castellaniella defragrans]